MENSQEVFDKNKNNVGRQETKEHRKAANQFIEESKKFFDDRVNSAKNEAKIWKQASFFMLIITILAVVALLLAMPFKTNTPYVLKVDTETGQSVLTKLVEGEQKVSYGEALDKHFIASFIQLRNGYQWDTVQNNFDTVKINSNDKVFAEYSNYIKAENSPLNIFKDRYKVKSELTASPVYLPSNVGDDKLVLVNFKRTIVNKIGDPVPEFPVSNWKATITYNFKKGKLTADQRLLNPLGFNVTSYREDKVLD